MIDPGQKARSRPVEGMDCAAVVGELRAKADAANVAGMARYGISSEGTLGVSVRELRLVARRIGRDHALAAELWSTGIHEARILAALVDEPSLVTETQMEEWIGAVDSWDVCDQICGNLFDRTGPLAYRKAVEWSARDETFVRRAGFVLMATLAVHDKGASDQDFLPFIEAVRDHGADPRPLVNKAASWGLRQMGKRSLALHTAAVEAARAIMSDALGTSGADHDSHPPPSTRFRAVPRGSRPARWLAADVLRELESPVVRDRVARKAGSPTTPGMRR